MQYIIRVSYTIIQLAAGVCWLFRILQVQSTTKTKTDKIKNKKGKKESWKRYIEKCKPFSYHRRGRLLQNCFLVVLLAIQTMAQHTPQQKIYHKQMLVVLVVHITIHLIICVWKYYLHKYELGIEHLMQIDIE